MFTNIKVDAIKTSRPKTYATKNLKLAKRAHGTADNGVLSNYITAIIESILYTKKRIVKQPTNKYQTTCRL